MTRLCLALGLLSIPLAGAAEAFDKDDGVPEMIVGGRLLREMRFAQFFFARRQGRGLAQDPSFECDPSVNYFAYGSGMDAAHTGTHSVKIVSVRPSGTLTPWLSKTTSIGATAGKTYAARAWFKAVNSTDHGVITINFWNSASQGLAGMDGGTICGTADWTQLSVSGTAPTGTAFIRVEFPLWGGGTLRADDVFLSQNREGRP